MSGNNLKNRIIIDQVISNSSFLERNSTSNRIKTFKLKRKKKEKTKMHKKSTNKISHAWNPWTKTTIFKTWPFCFRLAPDNKSVDLNLAKENGFSLYFWSKLVKKEFPLVERNGEFTARSTIIIGIREGSPNICISWIERLLICKRGSSF